MIAGVNLTRRDRGSFTVAFAGLTMVLALSCAMVLLRSLDTYHIAQVSSRRVQSRAAAEGAAVLLLTVQEPRVPVRLNNWQITYVNDQDTATSGTEKTVLEVALQIPDTATTAFTARYRATVAISPEGARNIEGLEMIP